MTSNIEGISAETVEAVKSALCPYTARSDRTNSAQAAITALLASGEVVIRNDASMVLQKVGFTCERTQQRHTFNSIPDFIMAFLRVKKERDEAKEREVVLRKDVQELVTMVRIGGSTFGYHAGVYEALARFTQPKAGA
jgi:hypothetical protein